MQGRRRLGDGCICHRRFSSHAPDSWMIAGLSFSILGNNGARLVYVSLWYARRRVNRLSLCKNRLDTAQACEHNQTHCRRHEDSRVGTGKALLAHTERRYRTLAVAHMSSTQQQRCCCAWHCRHPAACIFHAQSSIPQHCRKLM